MKLVIAEKPSLGRAIMTALGEKFENKGEYSQSKNYYVVPLHGHVLELKDFEKYPANKDKNMWKVENLPFFPGEYQYQISKGNKKIYDTIKKLLAQKNVTEVIHCGDADREGQLIIDTVLEKLGNKKKVTRPFIKSTTPQGLKQAFSERKPNEEYQNINAEGKTRSYVDFDFGINLSRYACAKAGRGLNVGRVIGAIVTEIYNRDIEIENFVPRDYFKVESDLEIKLTSKNEYDAQGEAQEYSDRLNGTDAIVTDIKKSKQEKKAPKLFSQTDLQGTANKRFGFSPKRTLKAAQSLYENGYITYPRTNTNFMAEGDKGFVESILKQLGEDFEMKPVFDDSKVDGHSAITPTEKIASGLDGDLAKIYNLVLNRFKAVFCKEPCMVEKTTVTIECIETFKVVGEIPITQGWKKYEPVSEQTVELPPLKVGDKVAHDFKPVATQTKPPAHYTVTTLGKWMQNPFRKSEDDEVDYAKMLSGMEIGTEATRAAIIDKAIAKDYIKLTKNTYTIQPNGRFLVETCKDLGIDMSSVKTAEMGRDTKAVSRGEKTTEEVLQSVRKEITDIVNANPQMVKESEYICPKCGKKLKESFVNFKCECGFTLWKTVAKKRLDEQIIELLLKGEKTPVIDGFQGRKGKFSAMLIPKKDGSVEFEFPAREELGKCPKCGKPILENKKAFGCSGWRDGCDFVIWKYDKVTKSNVTATQVKKLLAGEIVETPRGEVKLIDGRVELI